MCSVTFMPQPYGFTLAMNRDESLVRVPASPPHVFRYHGRAALHPHEASGGTWIGVNDAGLCGALLNWYAIPTDAQRVCASRGRVIPALLRATTLVRARALLHALDLTGTAPFRLVIASAVQSRVSEFRWDHDFLEEVPHRWERQHWFSSGFDEPGAQRTRSRAVHDAESQPDAGSLPWLRRLHRSHDPEPGPYCTCMHRADAGTVSYTEVDVSGLIAGMNYHDGPPCEMAGSTSILHLSRRSPWHPFVSPCPCEDPPTSAGHAPEPDHHTVS
jgi:hypothetical protein